MSLTVGTRLGPYEITAPIGAGGMGEVYKAKDTRLDRSVAIKILPAEVSADPDRRARFEREARTIAGLTHPHICTLYDVGEEDPSTGSGQAALYLVMEHLTGETLAQCLEKGPLPLDQALTVATEIAEALTAAHRQGVIHRDLKPGNVMLTRTGAKLLDFGLAKLKGHGEQAAAASLTSTPTEHTPLTAEGLIVGTLQYMAPEQVEGRAADARTDLWALGAILYEMLTGKRAFAGDSAASLIGNIMHAEPPALATLQPLTPPAVDRLVRKCLAKDPDGRWQSASDVADEARWIAHGSGAAAPISAVAVPGVPAGRLRRHPLLLVAAGLVLGALVIGALLWKMRPAGPARLITRSTVALTPAAQLGGSGIGFSYNAGGSRTAFAWTPDGRALVFSGIRDKARLLFVRHLDQDTAVPLEGTNGAQVPVVSPDGHWVAFFTFLRGAGVIQKVPLQGGASQAIAEGLVGAPRGMAWGPGDQVLFGANGCNTSVCGDEGRIWLAPGGPAPPTPVTELGPGELKHGLPQWLPGEGTFLYTVRKRDWSWGDEEVVVQSLLTKQRKVVLQNAADARYVPTGHLVFVRMGTLFAVPFDLAKLQVRGEPVAMQAGVVQALTGGHGGDLTGAGQFAIAPTGHLAYLPGGIVPYRDYRLVSVDRKGLVTPLPAAPVRTYMPFVRLSPDGQRLAVGIYELSQSGLWRADLARQGELTNLTREGEPGSLSWFPDGRRITLAWQARGVPHVALQAADGTGSPESLRKDSLEPADWTPDRKHLIGVKDGDIMELDLDQPTGGLQPLVQTAANEIAPSLSPDGRWLAYASDTSGRSAVYLRPYPGPGERVPVSTGDALSGSPSWNSKGGELFFIAIASGRQRMMVAPVDVSVTPPRVGTPRQLFEHEWNKLGLVCAPTRCYDVALDGQRFFAVQAEPVAPRPPTTQINLVLNWFEELKAKVPPGR